MRYFYKKYNAYAHFNKCIYNPRKVAIGPDVYRNFNISFPENLIIGDGTVLNGDCYINAHGGVSIGKYCHIGKGLTILSSNHNFRSEFFIPYDDEYILKSVQIGDAVWIGANVSIAPGCRIGDGAIIALGAVVRSDIESCAIVSGNPATVIGRRDKNKFDLLYSKSLFL